MQPHFIDFNAPTTEPTIILKATLKMSRLVLLAGVVLLVCVITTCSAVPHTRESRNSNQATTLLQDTNLTGEVLADLDNLRTEADCCLANTVACCPAYRG